MLREAGLTMQKHRARRGGPRFQRTSWLGFWNTGLKRLSWANPWWSVSHSVVFSVSSVPLPAIAHAQAWQAGLWW